MVVRAFLSGFKHLFKKRITLRYPDQKLLLPDKFRGRHKLIKELCIHCKRCALICPTKAITMVEFEEELYPEFNYARCVFCGLCVDECPKDAIETTTKYEMSVFDSSDLVYTVEEIMKDPEGENGTFKIILKKFSGASHYD